MTVLLVFVWRDLAAGQSTAAMLRDRPSQSAESQKLFVSGLDALHAFEYEDANEAFRRAEALDPSFVLAYWGEALTYHQTLWRHEDLRAGRDAIARLERAREGGGRASGADGATGGGTGTRVANGRRASERRAPRREDARTSTEAGLVEAARLLFGPGDSAARRRAYADAMQRVYERQRGDPDVASLYALALLGTMSRSLIGYEDAHEGRTVGLAGSPVQSQVAEILSGVLRAHPDHIGALHYLLHDYDDPEHAELGLTAARALAKAAPSSSHALHMPAHIFLQLGLWKDASRSDRAAFDASKARAVQRGLDGRSHNYHALGWLEYELLQRGQFGAASAAIEELSPVVKSSGLVPLLSDLSSMRARFAIETRRWDLFANEGNFSNVDDLFAIGVSTARTHRLDRAERVRAELATRAQSEREGDLRPAIAIMEREVAALVELESGNPTRAVEILQEAARAELQLPPPLGLPEPVKPAPELLGEVLIEAGRARDAIEPFAQALKRTRNRSLSVLGLARAYAAAGDIDKSREQYRALLANYENADQSVAEVDEARRAIGSSATASARTAAPTNATRLAEKRDDPVGARARAATGASKDDGAAPNPHQPTRIPMMTAAAGAIIASLVMFAVRARRSRASSAGARPASKKRRPIRRP